MIPITQQIAKRVRSVFRHLIPRGAAGTVIVHAGTAGLSMRLHGSEIRAQYDMEGSFEEEALPLPLAALADCEGKAPADVELQDTDTGEVQVRWNQDGIPCQRDYARPSIKPSSDWPVLPPLASACPGLVVALAYASASAADDAVRFALNHIQLRGDQGKIVATDGYQLLIQSGFAFPWPESLLLPASPVFKSPEFRDLPVSMGRSDTHLVLVIGPWTLWLPLGKNLRFPDCNQVLPKFDGKAAAVEIAAADALFAVQALAKLPGAKDQDAPITIEANGKVILRARGEDTRSTVELILARSQPGPNPASIAVNRRRLAQALTLGCTQLRFASEQPIECQAKDRRFVVMALAKGAIVPPDPNAASIASPPATSPLPKPRSPMNEKNRKTTPTPKNFGETQAESAQGEGQAESPKPQRSVHLHNLIEETRRLREQVQECHRQVTHILAGLKKQKSQSRLMSSTLQSLRQLQELDVGA